MANLSQCEVYACSNSGCREYFETFPALKEHIKTEHRSKSPAHYQFCYFIFNAKDNSEREIFRKLHTIYPKDW